MARGEAGLEDEDGIVPPLHSRRRQAAIGLAALIVLALFALWTQRRSIATRFVDQELASAGVPARYTIADLAPGRQRLTNVVIGDPADPDLVADWVETHVGYDLGGATLTRVTAGRLRLRARLVDGRLSLGAIDRLLPAPSGQPFAFPKIAVDVADARVRLETPAGIAGLRIAGAGRLDGGFGGTVAAVAPRLAASGCAGEGAEAALRVRITGPAAARVAGPVRLARAGCGGVTVARPRAEIAADLAIGADRGNTLDARIATGGVTLPGGRAAGVSGTVRLAQVAAGGVAGQVDLAAAQPRAEGFAARAATIAGRVAREAAGSVAFDGRAGIADADLSRRVPDLRGTAAGTPVGPVVERIAGALTAAARQVSGEAAVRATIADATEVAVGAARLWSGSGARLTVRPTREAPAVTWRDGAIGAAATLALAGGEMPTVRGTATRAGGATRGVVTVAPYAAGDARLALAPVRFAIGGRAARIATTATVSGPLGNGRVEGLTVPIDLRRDAGGAIVLAGGCAPVSWASLRVSGLTLDPARLALCPDGGALLRVQGGAASGGARIGATRLTGRLGGTPLRLAAAGGRFALTDRGFALSGVEALLGAPERVTRLSFGTLTGRVGAAVTGEFAGGGGQIGAVPLILSDAGGRWTLANGVLTVDGAMTVSDAVASPRFRPMAAQDVRLRLADNRIAATGRLAEPTTGTRVAEVEIAHMLSAGSGTATIAVPGMTFGEGFQPELLTPLTFGVVADVKGRVTSDARIAWSPRGVTSTGTFGTESMDLAAAFGPVTGIRTTIRFTDLLGMVTAPGQVATVATVNPGIQVEDGTVRYALEGPTLVRVEGARWPFAGGALTLEPTLLDFSADRERRMTFRVEGAGARAFLQQFDFENLDATGTFDGVLPMVFTEAGGRIENGRLTMREGGGTIAYVGQLGQEQLGFWGDLAFQALKSIRYRSLDVTLNGPLAGEMVTDVRFAGVSQGAGARSGFLANFIGRRLQRLPFVFNIRIRAPFRGLLDSAASFYDPRRLVQRNLSQLLEEQNRRTAPPAPALPSVQPPSSENQR